MTEEEKKAAEAAATANNGNTATIDYKAEFEKAQDRIKKAEHTIEEEKKNRTQDAEAAKTVATETAQKEIEKFKLEQTKNFLDEELSKIENEDERKLVEFNYQNRIVKSDFSRQGIQESVKIARLMANAPKLEKTLSEMKNTAISQQTRNTTGTTTGQDNTRNINPLVPEEENWIKETAIRTGKKEEEVRARLLANRNGK